MDVGREARLLDDLLHLLAGGLGDPAPPVEHKGYGGGGNPRHAGDITNGQFLHIFAPKWNFSNFTGSKLKLYIMLVRKTRRKPK